MTNKLDYVVRSLSRGTHKKYETFVVNAIYNRLQNPNLAFATQQSVLTLDGTKYIDMYFPQIKVAIEIDEWYHNSESQSIKDNQRAENIKTAVIDSTITDSIHEITFLRIPIYDKNGAISLEELSSEIDEKVEIIKMKIMSLSEPLKWMFDENDRMNEIINKGYIKRGDSLSSMKNILHVFGKEVRGYQKCTYNLKTVSIWSPTLSFDGSNRSGWINTISDDLSKIYESGTNGKKKTKFECENDEKNSIKRLVFLKYKDALGNRSRRFIGVYMCSGFDDQKQAEIWEFKSERAELK